MRFSVMLVQPHLKQEKQLPWRPWLELDRLTQASLHKEGAVDLLVWPESSLSLSPLEDPGRVTSDAWGGMEYRLTVADFTNTLRPCYRTNCLAGVAMWRQATEMRYGLQVPKIERYNCGCLVSRSGEISCHEKQALVPFKEALPRPLDQAWIRSRLLPLLQFEAAISAGDQFRLLSFPDHDDEERTIAVSICYEAFLFWLPQYGNRSSIDAIVHLVYDGVWADHPELIQRQILACRYRAMETRTWNLVCSTWAGSAIIDPRGEVVFQLPAESGVLRSDWLAPIEGIPPASHVTATATRADSGIERD
jgi:apolipoprotein N-acyltransferase